jgi:fumarate hydratase class II
VTGVAVDAEARPQPNAEHIGENPAKSLGLVTPLNPRIGYDKAVKIGKSAPANTITPKRGFVRPEDCNRWGAPARTAAAGALLEGGAG